MDTTGYEAEFLASREPSFRETTPKLLKTPAATRSPLKTTQKSGREFSPLLHTVKKDVNGGYKKTLPERPSSLLDYDGSVNFSDSMESFHDKSRLSAFKHPPNGNRSADKRSSRLAVGDVSTLALKEQEKLLETQKNQILDLQLKVHLLQRHLAKLAPENVQAAIKENVNLQGELADLKRKYDKMGSLYEEAIAQKNDNPQDNDNPQTIQIVSDMQDNISDLKYEIRQLNKQLDEKIDEIAALREKNDHLERYSDIESSESREARDRLDRKLAEINHREEKLRQREEELDNREQDLKHDNGYFHNESEAHNVQELHDRIEDLEYELRQAESAKEEVEDRLQQLQDRSSHENIQQLRDRIQDLEYDLRREQAVKKVLEERLQHSQDRSHRNTHLESDHQHCQAEKQKLLDQIEELESDLHVSKKELYAQQQLVSSLQDKLQEKDALSRLNGDANSSRLDQTQQAELEQNLEEQQFKFEQERIVLKRVRIHYKNHFIVTNQDIQSKIQAIRESEEARHELEDQLSTAKRELSSARGDMDVLKSLVERCKNDAESFKKERDILERNMRECQDKLSTLSNRASESRIAAAANNEEADRIREQLTDAQQDLARLQSEYSTKSSEWSRTKSLLEEKISSLEEINANHEAQRENLLKDKADVQSVMETENQRYDEMKRSMQIEIDQKMAEIERHQKLVDRLSQDSVEHDFQVQRLTKELKEWQQDCASAQVLWEAAEVDKSKLETEVAKLSATVGSLENTVAALRHINSTESDARAISESKLGVLEKKLADSGDLVQELQQKLQQADLNIQLLENKSRFTSEKLDLANKSMEQFKSRRADISAVDPLVLSRYEQKRAKLEDEVNKLKEALELARKDADYHRNAVLKLKQRLKTMSSNLNSNSRKGDASSKDGDVKSLMQHLKYLKSRVTREKQYRGDLTFMKSFFLKQIAAYQACNNKDLQILEDMGIYPDYEKLDKVHPQRRTMRGIAFAVVAAIRFKKRSKDIQAHREMKSLIVRAK